MALAKHSKPHGSLLFLRDYVIEVTPIKVHYVAKAS
ncbi:hypothetical protein COLO4_19566 [Corchorus olitorius]|uniref:Uncharacterized protein n=1 Tax=Corchorus olitorius TaxID=93759 RepID=A0A1R3J4U8_9ROSI|nr:hypothetical protein COLO4_19566 [Corchorus olitorius]